MAKLAQVWRPWRGVAAHLLWAYYHAVKRREGAPVTEKIVVATDKAKAKKTTNGAGRGR
jgi:DNA-3-methyladenine glycosylase II